MSRTRQVLLPAVAAAAGVAVLVLLGVWQLQRLQWKEALIALVERGLAAAPVPAPGPEDWASLDLGEIAYQPVAVAGLYLNGEEIFVNRTLIEPRGAHGGYGFFVMTPFTTDRGWVVYVNRGFVPRERKSAETRHDGQIKGETAVVGLLRLPRRRAWFMPADDALGNEWFSRDPALFAQAQGRPAAIVAPYLIDARLDPRLPDGLPHGGQTIISFPNNHLGYALTWFGLAAGLAGVFVVFAWGKRG